MLLSLITPEAKLSYILDAARGWVYRVHLRLTYCLLQNVEQVQAQGQAFLAHRPAPQRGFV